MHLVTFVIILFTITDIRRCSRCAYEGERISQAFQNLHVILSIRIPGFVCVSTTTNLALVKHLKTTFAKPVMLPCHVMSHNVIGSVEVQLSCRQTQGLRMARVNYFASDARLSFNNRRTKDTKFLRLRPVFMLKGIFQECRS